MFESYRCRNRKSNLVQRFLQRFLALRWGKGYYNSGCVYRGEDACVDLERSWGHEKGASGGGGGDCALLPYLKGGQIFS